MHAFGAIAALRLVTDHIAFPSGLLDPGHMGRQYFGRLDVGVAVFFLISGFLLYRPFAPAPAGGAARPATGAYAWGRFLGIPPRLLARAHDRRAGLFAALRLHG